MIWGAGEEELVNSGLEETMITAFNEVYTKSKEKVIDHSNKMWDVTYILLRIAT
jgi:hypothetical protein